jgi:hypothetical protein
MIPTVVGPTQSIHRAIRSALPITFRRDGRLNHPRGRRGPPVGAAGELPSVGPPRSGRPLGRGRRTAGVDGAITLGLAAGPSVGPPAITFARGRRKQLIREELGTAVRRRERWLA